MPRLSSTLSPRERKAQEGLFEKRTASISWARRILSRPENYLILDVETTGYGKSDRIIQIALLRPDGQRVVNALIDPLMHIPEDVAEKCHHITDEMVSGKPHFSSIASLLVDRIKDKTVVGWNVEFDMRMIQQELDRTTMLYPSFEREDAMCRYAAYKMIKSSRYALENATKEISGDDGYKQAHRAMSDCIDTLHVIKYMAKE